MQGFNIYVSKARIKKIREFRRISKSKLDKEGIISRRQLIRVEDLEDESFLSIDKLFDLAFYFDYPIEYLLGVYTFEELNDLKLFHILKSFISKKAVEPDFDVEGSTAFFCFKDCDEDFVSFLKGYQNILRIKNNISNDSFNRIIHEYLFNKY